MYDDNDYPFPHEFDDAEDVGGVATLEFQLLTPATLIEDTERELAAEFDPESANASIASIALRRWQWRGDHDVALIERLADGDFAITYHAEQDGSVSIDASLWFATIDEADATLHALGAQGRTASFYSTTPKPDDRRFVVGFAALADPRA